MGVTENHVDIPIESCFSQLAGFFRRIDSDFVPFDWTIARRWKLRWLMVLARLVAKECKLLLVLRIRSVGVIAGGFAARPGKGADHAGLQCWERAKS
jgi:hypothetical protein